MEDIKRKKIVVEIIGGLGNQMFQYAFYLALKEMFANTDFLLYIGRFDAVRDNKGYELNRIFELEDIFIEKSDVERLIDDNISFLSKLRRRLIGPHKTFYNEKTYKFHKGVFHKIKYSQVLYLRGLWQDELYFSSIRETILNTFVFPLNTDELNMNILENIRMENSVSIHVRRGDYISDKKYKNILGGVCTIEYYKRCVGYIKSKTSNPSFYIFSDDPIWAKENFNFFEDSDKLTFVSINTGLNSYKDMQLISNCKHNIIANSTFSWWGAWLNQDKQKIVIAPKKWFKNDPFLEDNHIVPDSWIKISNE